MGDFGNKYANGKPTKDHGNHPLPGMKLNRQQENNTIVNTVVDKILLHETQKVGAVREAPEFLDSDYDENQNVQVEKWVLKTLNKNFNDVIVCLNANRKVDTGLKIKII